MVSSDVEQQEGRGAVLEIDRASVHRSPGSSYGAPAVVQLIKIRTLAEAGVPLARVQELLDADAETFAAATDQIDRRLRTEIRALQEHRRRIRQLAAGDSLALPDEVVAFLDWLRDSRVPAALVEGERDGWILVAARWPEQIPWLMADKQAQLDDSRTLELYRLIGELVELGAEDDARLDAVADQLVQMLEEAAERGEFERQGTEMNDEGFIALLDSFASDSHPMMGRLQERDRRARMDRMDPDRATLTPPRGAYGSNR